MSHTTLARALATACRLGHIDAVHTLLDAGADPNATDALADAAAACREDIVHALLDAGATVTTTALRAAACQHYTDVLEMLLAAMSGISLTDIAELAVEAGSLGYTTATRCLLDYLAQQAPDALRLDAAAAAALD